MRQWIQATYGEYVLPVEIPKTTVTSNKSAEFATVYDVQKYDGSAKTYKRAVDAYDRFVDLIEQSAIEAWKARKQAAMMPASDMATRLPQAPNRSLSMSTGNLVATQEGTPR